MMEDSPRIMLEDEPVKNIYPLALNTEGRDTLYVGRMHHDYSAENALKMWCVSDNLIKRTALNT